MLWLLIIAAIAVTPTDATIRTLDGVTVQGSLTAWNELDIELMTDSGTQLIPKESITQILFALPKESQAAPAVKLHLTDGTVIPTAGCKLEESRVVALGPIWSADKMVQWVPKTESVQAIRFDLSTPGQDEAWQQLVDRERTADLLVVYKKSRGTLDYVEGVVESISATIATIMIDGEAIEVPQERVFGIVFYQREKLSPPQNAVRILGAFGLTLIASDVRLTDKSFAVEFAGGMAISLPQALVSKIVFATGAVIYVSDLPQLSGSPKWRPFFELPSHSTLMDSWGLPRRDESFDGQILQVYMTDENGRPAIREFQHGLAMRSRSEFACSLPEGFRFLRAVIGIDPQAQVDADALLLIELDGRPVGEWRVARGEAGQELEIDLTGKRQLRLIVDFGSGTDAGDVVHICDPRLVK